MGNWRLASGEAARSLGLQCRGLTGSTKGRVVFLVVRYHAPRAESRAWALNVRFHLTSCPWPALLRVYVPPALRTTCSILDKAGRGKHETGGLGLSISLFPRCRDCIGRRTHKHLSGELQYLKALRARASSSWYLHTGLKKKAGEKSYEYHHDGRPAPKAVNLLRPIALRSHLPRKLLQERRRKPRFRNILP